MRYLSLILLVCACDAGTKHTNELCTPLEVGPSGYVTHTQMGRITAGRTYLLDQLKARSVPSANAVDGQLWRLVEAYCRPCTIPGEPKPIREMFPVAYISEAVAAGCFSLTLDDGRIVYGDLRSRLGISMFSTQPQ
jgi:hypothetical protein